MRLIRSKGVGVYFVTQNPLDVPDTVLGQLGNRVQHALRAFTPRDQKAVEGRGRDVPRRTRARRRRPSITRARRRRGAGLDCSTRRAARHRRARVRHPAASQIGAITIDQRRQVVGDSLVGTYYDNAVDRESAYELLKKKGEASAAAAQAETAASAAAKERAQAEKDAARAEKDAARERRAQDAAERAASRPRRQTKSTSEKMVEAAATSAVRSVGSSLGRSLTRGLLGSLFGKK